MAQDIQYKRQTAFKTTIKDVVDGSYVKKEGMEPSYVLDRFNRHLCRVNIMATVLSEPESFGSSTNIVIDDSTQTIQVRYFDPLPPSSVGDVVIVIGKVREYNGSKYVIAEIIKKVDPAWLKVRKKELQFTTSIEETADKDVIEDMSFDNPTDEIYTLIKDLDQGSGADIEQIIAESSGEDAEKIINNLLKEGEIFEISPGKLKVLE